MMRCLRNLLLIIPAALMPVAQAVDMPTREQLEKLLDKHFTDATVCIRSEYFSPPIIVSRTDPYFRLMNYFVRVGFYERFDTDKKPNKDAGNNQLSLILSLAPTANVEYKLTDLGKRYYKEIPDPKNEKIYGEYCYGKLGLNKVLSVKSLSDKRYIGPDDIAVVDYSYSMVKYQPWSENYIVTERFPDVQKNLDSRKRPFHGRVWVKHSEEGWAFVDDKSSVKN